MDEEKRTPVLVFDDSVKDKVLKSMGFSKGRDSELLDEEGKTVTSQDYDNISYEEFGGVLRGSKVPIKNEESELIKYFVSENR